MNPIKQILTGFLNFMLLSLVSQIATHWVMLCLYFPPHGGFVVLQGIAVKPFRKFRNHRVYCVNT
jgi:hypothetical protein